MKGSITKGILECATEYTVSCSSLTSTSGKNHLPDLHRNWVDLCVEGVLVPGHIAHSFLRASPESSTFDPVASFVSAVNLHRDCPPSLILSSRHLPARTLTVRSG